jgi:mono/diheme cytochrome c family protein
MTLIGAAVNDGAFIFGRRAAMKFLIALVTALLALGAVSYLVVSTGRFDIAATTPPGVIEKLAPRVRDRSIHARAEAFKASTDPEVVAHGLEHYRDNCLPCHGAPGIEAAEFHEGMNPAPPEMDSTDVQKYTDGELYWIVKNGIRFTGMPSFGKNHRDDEIGDIVAFVRHVPQLSAAERQALMTRAAGDHHHEGAEAEENHQHESAAGGDHHHHHGSPDEKEERY